MDGVIPSLYTLQTTMIAYKEEADIAVRSGVGVYPAVFKETIRLQLLFLMSNGMMPAMLTYSIGKGKNMMGILFKKK